MGLALVGLIAFVPALSYLLVAVAWIFSGLGMGLATSSSSLAVMSLSAAAEQGRNASSLNVADALGSGIFVGIAGSIFAALQLERKFGPDFWPCLQLSMAVVGVLAVLTSRRIGVVRNEFAPTLEPGESNAAPRW